MIRRRVWEGWRADFGEVGGRKSEVGFGEVGGLILGDRRLERSGGGRVERWAETGGGPGTGSSST